MKKITAALLSLLCISSIAFASEGEGLPWGNFAWRILNLIIFVGIIYYFAGNKIKSFFGGRKEKIIAELKELEERKLQAIKDLEDVEKRIKNIDAERKAIIDASVKSAEEMALGIIKDAEKMAAQISAQAVKNMENATKSLENEIKSKIADEICSKLEENVIKNLGQTEHKKLINNSLSKVVL